MKSSFTIIGVSLAGLLLPLSMSPAADSPPSGTGHGGTASSTAGRSPTAGLFRSPVSPGSLIVRAIRVHGGQEGLLAQSRRLTMDAILRTFKPFEGGEHIFLRHKGSQTLVTVNSGPFQEEIYLGQNGGWKWMHGAMTTLSSPEYTRMTQDMNHSVEKLLQSERPGSKLMDLGMRTLPDGTKVRAVRLIIPSGLATDYYFDRANGRVAALGYTGYDSRRGVNVAYLERQLDYQLWQGVPTSFRQDTYEDGVLTQSLRIIHLDLKSDIPDAVFARPLLPRNPIRSARVPFDFSQGMIVVNASINGGPPHRFMVDTGASITVLLPEAVEDLDLDYGGIARLSAIGGAVSARLARVSSLQVGRAAVHNVDVAVVDEPSWSFGGLAGVLGYTFLSHYQVTFDYGAREMRLASPSTPLPPGAPVHIDTDDGVPVIHARARGQVFPMIVDTGAMITVLPARTASLLRLQGVLHRSATGADGTPILMRLARLPDLTAGGKTEHGTVVTFSPPGGLDGPRIGDSADGLLGSPFLRRYRITLDYPRQQAVFTPASPGSLLPDDFTQPGVDLISDASFGQARVFSLFKGSPAERAGLQLGQPVIAIDGRPTAGVSSLALAIALRGAPNTTVRLTVLVDGRPKIYALRRVRLI